MGVEEVSNLTLCQFYNLVEQIPKLTKFFAGGDMKVDHSLIRKATKLGRAKGVF